MKGLCMSSHLAPLHGKTAQRKELHFPVFSANC
jgi:hypothetical protein